MGPMSDEEIKAIASKVKKEIHDTKRGPGDARAEKNKKKGTAFLAQNKKKRM
jgi:FKBP-type peptidyl-prolyl isomerase-like protein